MKLTRDKIQRMIGSAGYGSSAGGSGGGGGEIIGYATQTWVKSLRWWGATFDPQATDPDNVTGALTGVTDITASGNITAGGNLTVTGNITSSGTITGATLAATTAMTLGGKAVATQEWTGQNYVSIAFFSRLFQAYNGSTAVNPNDLTTTIDNIKAMFGFWTDQYLTALGKNPNVQPSSLYLSQLADVSIPSPTDGQVLTYSAQTAKWIASNVSSGTDMATVWANLAAADASKQIDISHLSNALSGYLPLTGGTMTGTINFMNADGGLSYISSPITPGKSYQLPNLNSSAVALFAQYSLSSDEGGIVISEDTAIIYNSFDTGWGFQVLDKDVNGGDMSLDSSRAFGITQEGHFAWSNGGFKKNGSDDSYVLLGGGGHAAISALTVANATNCLPLAGGTMTGTINFMNANGGLSYISSPITPGKSYQLPNLTSSAVVLFAQYSLSPDEGGIVISEDTAIIYNSFDTGWGFQVLDKDVNGGDMSLDSSRAFGITQEGHFAWSNGGFKKNGSDDSYVLLGGGGHAAISALSVNYATSAGDAETLGGTAKSGLFTSLSSTWATNLSATIGGTTLDISSLNADYAGQLRYSRSIWGQSFNGTADVSGDLYLAGSNLRLLDYNNSADCYIVGYRTGSSRAIGVAVEGSSLFEFNDEEFYSAVGIYAASYVTALSDIRYKNVIRHFALDAETIANASLIQFRWKDGTDKATHVGGIAQEWQAFLPEAVHETKDGKLSMDYGVIAYTAAVSLAKKVVAQQHEIDDLKQRLERLERIIDRVTK